MRLLIAIFAGLLGLTLWTFFGGWSRLNWHMGVHGWIALTLGVVVSLALGGGLMALSFYSDRRGYDDRAGGEPAKADDDEPSEHP
jgi:hypothetical protein